MSPTVPSYADVLILLVFAPFLNSGGLPKNKFFDRPGTDTIRYPFFFQSVKKGANRQKDKFWRFVTFVLQGYPKVEAFVVQNSLKSLAAQGFLTYCAK